MRQKELLDPWVAKLFGYHLLQLKSYTAIDLCTSSKIQHNFSLLPQWSAKPQVVAEELLPFATESIDVVLVHHVLENCAQPHLLLRELARVLIPSGHLLIVGFNPYSCLAVSDSLRKKDKRQFRNPLLSVRQLSDYLALLDFAIDRVEYGYSHPSALAQLSVFTSTMSQRLCNWQPPIGSFYVLHAVKQVSRMTPLVFQKPMRKGKIEIAAPSAYNKPQKSE